MLEEKLKDKYLVISISFLGILRNKYLLRQQGKDKGFSSVILAGVYDIKNLKLKIRDNEDIKYNFLVSRICQIINEDLNVLIWDEQVICLDILKKLMERSK